MASPSPKQQGYFVLSERDPTFLHETWGLFGLGTAFLVARFAVRFKTVGLMGLRWDDFFAFLVMCLYVIDAVTVFLVYHMGTNIEGVALSAERELTTPEMAQLVEGSKLQLTAWYSYASLVWCLKGTMVCFFLRMTTGITSRSAVKWIGIACIVSYVPVFLTITFGCWPIYRNFQFSPDPGATCTLKPQNFIVMTVLNVLTDAAILSIPLPLLWTLQVPARQKVVIGILLSSGIFVITAAIIRICITLGSTPSALTINRWGVRETLVGIIAVNAPILRPVFNKSFWTGMPTYGYGSSGGGYGASKGLSVAAANGDQVGPHGPYELTSSIHNDKDGRPVRRQSLTGSEDSIMVKSAPIGVSTVSVPTNHNHHQTPEDGTVVVHTRYEVTEEPRQASRTNHGRHSSDWDDPSGFHKASAYGGGGSAPR